MAVKRVAGGIDITLLGDKALQKKFAKLHLKAQKKVFLKANRKAAKVLLKSIKSKAPVDTGALKRNIKIRKIDRSRTKIGLTIRTGTREEMGISEKSKWYYPAIVEYGNPKKQLPAKSYMRAGFNSAESQARKVLASEIGSGIERVAKEKV